MTDRAERLGKVFPTSWGGVCAPPSLPHSGCGPEVQGLQGGSGQGSPPSPARCLDSH